MTVRVLDIVWTLTGHKPHLLDPDYDGYTYCGRPASVPVRCQVELSDSDPAGGLCRKCEPLLREDR